MKNKKKSGRKESEVLYPVNGDARAFLSNWGERDKISIEQGSFLCKACGDEFDHPNALHNHCLTVHAGIYPGGSIETETLYHIRCRMCGHEMKDTPTGRKVHLRLHGQNKVITACKLMGVSNLFEKF
jgi:hypothetical protein